MPPVKLPPVAAGAPPTVPAAGMVAMTNWEAGTGYASRVVLRTSLLMALTMSFMVVAADTSTRITVSWSGGDWPMTVARAGSAAVRAGTGA